MIDFKLPELGENISTAEVIRVLVGEGDMVKADQNVLEVESEKAAMPLPCPHAGRVSKVHVREGESVSVGQTLLSIEENAEARSEEKKPKVEKPEEEKAEEEKPEEKKAEKKKPEGEKTVPAQSRTEEARPPEQERDGQRSQQKAPVEKNEPAKAKPMMPVAAGPATRRLARELGVDLSQVHGSGSGGRVTREDVQAAVRNRSDGNLSQAPQLPDFSKWGPIERQGLNAIARVSARRLQLAWQLVPHVTQHALADITDLEAARRRLEAERDKSSAKITVTALAVKAVVVALKAFPHFNSSFDSVRDELVLKRYYHIGVAVDTERGLLVPVIRNADQKSLRAIAAELSELAEKARQRALDAEVLQGGTFTISNLGGIGGAYFTPIINYPEVALLGIARAGWQLVQEGEQYRNRLFLPLSLSYDHRVINGADGARFVSKLIELLSDPLRLLFDS